MRNLAVYNGLVWKTPHESMTMGMLGLIPSFLSALDDRPVAAQINDNYRHGGGWMNLSGFEVLEGCKLIYEGDENDSYDLLAETKVGKELVQVYEMAWVAVIQPDGSLEVARLD